MIQEIFVPRTKKVVDPKLLERYIKKKEEQTRRDDKREDSSKTRIARVIRCESLKKVNAISINTLNFKTPKLSIPNVIIKGLMKKLLN